MKKHIIKIKQGKPIKHKYSIFDMAMHEKAYSANSKSDPNWKAVLFEQNQ